MRPFRAPTPVVLPKPVRANMRPFLIISFIHVTLLVTSSQLGKVAVGCPFVSQCDAEFSGEFNVSDCRSNG